MKILIVNTEIEESTTSRRLTGLDSALSLELYKNYRHLRITANHVWDRYILIDEEEHYIGTFRTMGKLLSKHSSLENCSILTYDKWLNKINPEWRSVPRYQY